MDKELATYSQSEQVERALEALAQQKLEPGTVIQTKLFEDLLGIKSNTRVFGMLISDIRRILCERGLWLSGQGYNGEAFEIGDPRENYWVAKLAVARAERDLETKLILLKNTPMQGFSNLQTRRHENMMREISMKLSAIQRIEEKEHLLNKKRKIANEPTI